MCIKFKTEVEKLKQWAKTNYPTTRNGEWECDYPDWSALNLSFIEFINKVKPSELLPSDIDDLIYVIARDNEIEELVIEVSLKRELFNQLLDSVLDSDESDAKWQFAVVLGNGNFDQKFAEDALLKLVDDSDEYTSRMALHSLGKIRSSYTEELCKKAWDSNLEYQRIMSLWTLKEIESSILSNYLQLALEDGRKYLVQNVNKIIKA